MPRLDRMPRQFRKAISWIATEDNAGDDDCVDALGGYLTVCLVADLWRVNRQWVAQLVWDVRHPYQAEPDRMRACVIADNGGGLTLKITVRDTKKCVYQHTYSTAEMCAYDIRAYLDIDPRRDVGKDLERWDKNDCARIGKVEPTDAEIRNGVYRVLDVADLDGIDLETESWPTVRALAAALRR